MAQAPAPDSFSSATNLSPALHGVFRHDTKVVTLAFRLVVLAFVALLAVAVVVRVPESVSGEAVRDGDGRLLLLMPGSAQSELAPSQLVELQLPNAKPRGTRQVETTVAAVAAPVSTASLEAALNIDLASTEPVLAVALAAEPTALDLGSGSVAARVQLRRTPLLELLIPRLAKVF